MLCIFVVVVIRQKATNKRQRKNIVFLMRMYFVADKIMGKVILLNNVNN